MFQDKNLRGPKLAHLIDDIFWNPEFKSADKWKKEHKSVLVFLFSNYILPSAAGTRCCSIGHMGARAC